jgi:iron complex transport system ATP-binding protein
MKHGRIVAEGAPRDVIDATVVTDVFGLDCEVTPDPLTGAPMVLPRGRHHMCAAGPAGPSARG